MTERDRQVAREMGYPWDRLTDVVADLDSARQAVDLAGVAGNHEAFAVATFEAEGAIRRQQHVRGELADVLLLMLQAALDERPGGINRLLPRLLKEAGYAALLVELANDLKTLKQENWELAREVAALKRERENSNGW